MTRFIFAVVGAMVLVMAAKAQTATSIEEVLQQVETNNKTLKAYSSYVESKQLQFQTTNNLPDPQVSAYYMPFGNNETADYSEFEISQRVEFPTVYTARKNWIEGQGERLKAAYRQKRQEILLKAKKLCYEWIYLQQRKGLAGKRIEQARQVYEQVQTLKNKGQTGILQLNKAKVAWLDQQYELEAIKTQQLNVQDQLKSLNGDQTIEINFTAYPSNLSPVRMDSLWATKSRMDAELTKLSKQKEAAKQKIKVQQNKLLPDITAGYNYQGVPGSNYNGIYGGISIPLWSNKNKVKQARAEWQYRDQQQGAIRSQRRGEFEVKVNRYAMLLKKFREYEAALEGIDSETLLQKSYELGEISFLEYYREVQFYRQAEDRLMEMEKELYQIKATLYQHQL